MPALSLLKKAVSEMNLDLLDLLLERDKRNIDNNSMFTDTWGEWWGMLYEMVLRRSKPGVSILLKHGARVDVKNWGDCIELTPLELATQLMNNCEDEVEMNRLQEIITLLTNPKSADYIRKTNPAIPILTDKDHAIDRADQLQKKTGLRFQDENFFDT